MLRLFQFFFGPLVSIYKVFPLARKLFDFSYMLFKKKGGVGDFCSTVQNICMCSFNPALALQDRKV